MSIATLTDFNGIRNTVPARQIGPGDLAAAVNVDVNDAKRLMRRDGFTAFDDSDGADSLFRHGSIVLFRRSNTIRRLLPSASSEVIVSNVANPVVFWGEENRIYWTDGLRNGVIEDGAGKAWGITPPASLPTYAERVTGSLPRGRYLFALTYVRDGLESGTGRSGQTTELQGGIDFANLPTASGIDEKRLYLSRPDGTKLYLAAVLAPGATTASYTGDTTTLTIELETQFLQPPPAGACLAVHNGCALVGVGEFLLFSKPYRHDLFDPVRMSYRFDAPIRMLAPVQGGVFVGTDNEIAYLGGDDIAAAARDVKAGYGVIPGTLAYTEGHHIGEGMAGRAALAASTRGVCLLGDGGQFRNLTLDRYVMPAGVTGAGVVRLEEGKNRYIAVVRGL